MVKIKGKKFRRVPMKKNGSCPVGSRKYRRGRSKRMGCYAPAGNGKK